MPVNLAHALRLVLVTDDEIVAGRDLVALCRAAERGGVTAVQLRLKRADPHALAGLARALLAAMTVPLIINDRLDVALATGAAGVHLGQEDVPVGLARRIVPPGFVIGASVGSLREVPGGTGADYWGVGPLRSSATKADAGVAIGPKGLADICRVAPRGVACVAIGGVLPEDWRSVVQAGGTGVAVVRGILGADDVEGAARRYARAATGP